MPTGEIRDHLREHRNLHVPVLMEEVRRECVGDEPVVYYTTRFDRYDGHGPFTVRKEGTVVKLVNPQGVDMPVDFLKDPKLQFWRVCKCPSTLTGS